MIASALIDELLAPYTQPSNIFLTADGSLRIASFYRACEVNATDTHTPYDHPSDKLEYRARLAHS